MWTLLLCTSFYHKLMLMCHAFTSHYHELGVIVLFQKCLQSWLVVVMNETSWPNPAEAIFACKPIPTDIRCASHTIVIRITSYKFNARFALSLGRTVTFLSANYHKLPHCLGVVRSKIKYNDTQWHVDGLGQELDVTTLLTHWSYVFLALTHQYKTELLTMYINVQRNGLPISSDAIDKYKSISHE